MYGQLPLLISTDTFHFDKTSSLHINNMYPNLDAFDILNKNDFVYFSPRVSNSCKPFERFYYFDVSLDTSIIGSLMINNLPKKIKSSNFYPVVSLKHLNRFLCWNPYLYNYIIITDTAYNYINYKKFPKLIKNTAITNNPFFKLNNDIYFSYNTIEPYYDLYSRISTGFAKLPIYEFLNNNSNKIKLKEHINVYPCDFSRRISLKFDRDLYIDEIRNILWIMDIYTSAVAKYYPENNDYKCYELPKEVFRNSSEFNYIKSQDPINVKESYNKVIINSRNVNVGYSKQIYFSFLPDNDSILFRTSWIWSSDSSFVQKCDSMVSFNGIALDKPVDANIKLYVLYEFYKIDKVSTILGQILISASNYIEPIQVFSNKIVGFKLLRDKEYMQIPAIINWHLKDM